MPENTIMTFTDRKQYIGFYPTYFFFFKLNIPADTSIDLLIGTEA